MLFFDDESNRAAFVKHLRMGMTDITHEIRVKEMREEELLKEALTKDQRAQIVETFIRHAFSKVLSPLRCLRLPLLLNSGSSFKFDHMMTSVLV